MAQQSVLSRIGKGLISFGTGIPQIDLDTAETNNRLNEVQIRRLEQNIEADEQAAIRQQQMGMLVGAVQAGGADAQEAANRLFQLDPELANNLFDSMGAKTTMQREDAARRAFEIQSAPPEQREAIIRRQVAELRSQGRDPSHTETLLEMTPEEQNAALTFTQGAALSAGQRQTAANAAGRDERLPAGVQEFDALIERAQSDDPLISKAAQVELGTQARASSSLQERIANDPALAALVASSQADIKEATKFAEMTGASRSKFIDEGYQSIQSIDSSIRNLGEAITAIDEGASTGAIESRFAPTIRASTVALENVQKKLALDVINSATFGPLSEKELALALETALPTGLEPPELRQWIVDKQEAQRKLRNYYVDQINHLDTGGTVASFVRQQKRAEDAQPKPGTVVDSADQLPDGTHVVDENGVAGTIQNGQFVPDGT